MSRARTATRKDWIGAVRLRRMMLGAFAWHWDGEVEAGLSRWVVAVVLCSRCVRGQRMTGMREHRASFDDVILEVSFAMSKETWEGAKAMQTQNLV